MACDHTARQQEDTLFVLQMNMVLLGLAHAVGLGDG